MIMGSVGMAFFLSGDIFAQQNFSYSSYMENMGSINPTWYLLGPSRY